MKSIRQILPLTIIFAVVVYLVVSSLSIATNYINYQISDKQYQHIADILTTSELYPEAIEDYITLATKGYLNIDDYTAIVMKDEMYKAIEHERLESIRYQEWLKEYNKRKGK